MGVSASQVSYRFKLFEEGAGVGAGFLHCPMPVVVPVTRPEASRWMPETRFAAFPRVVVVPVSRPEASRYCVRLPVLVDVLVSALPVIRPLVSR